MLVGVILYGRTRVQVWPPALCPRGLQCVTRRNVIRCGSSHMYGGTIPLSAYVRATPPLSRCCPYYLHYIATHLHVDLCQCCGARVRIRVVCALPPWATFCHEALLHSRTPAVARATVREQSRTLTVSMRTCCCHDTCCARVPSYSSPPPPAHP